MILSTLGLIPHGFVIGLFPECLIPMEILSILINPLFSSLLANVKLCMYTQHAIILITHTHLHMGPLKIIFENFRIQILLYKNLFFYLFYSLSYHIIFYYTLWILSLCFIISYSILSYYTCGFHYILHYRQSEFNN